MVKKKKKSVNARDMGLIPNREDPTGIWPVKPVCHDSWVCALEPGSCNFRTRAPEQKSPQGEVWAPQREQQPLLSVAGEQPAQQRRPSSVKTINVLKFKKKDKQIQERSPTA